MSHRHNNDAHTTRYVSSSWYQLGSVRDEIPVIFVEKAHGSVEARCAMLDGTGTWCIGRRSKLNEAQVSAASREPDGSGGKRARFSCHALYSQREPEKRYIMSARGPYGGHALIVHMRVNTGASQGADSLVPTKGVYGAHYCANTLRFNQRPGQRNTAGVLDRPRTDERWARAWVRKPGIATSDFPVSRLCYQPSLTPSSMCTGVGLTHRGQSLR